jgi:hypothetical protein
MRRYAGILLLGCILGCRARGDGKEENALREQFMQEEMKRQGGQGAWEISQQPTVRLGPEWGALEPMFSGGRYLYAHRWMGQFASLRLSADGTETMVLHLRGVVPLNTLRGDSAFHVRSGGVHLDTFYPKRDEEKLEHDIFLDRATIERFRQGPYLILDIEATSPRAGERGFLGYSFALQGVTWRPLGAAPE